MRDERGGANAALSVAMLAIAFVGTLILVANVSSVILARRAAVLALARAAKAAMAAAIDPVAYAAGEVALDEGVAASELRRMVAANLALDPQTLAPLAPGRWDAVEVADLRYFPAGSQPDPVTGRPVLRPTLHVVLAVRVTPLLPTADQPVWPMTIHYDAAVVPPS